MQQSQKQPINNNKRTSKQNVNDSNNEDQGNRISLPKLRDKIARQYHQTQQKYIQQNMSTKTPVGRSHEAG